MATIRLTAAEATVRSWRPRRPTSTAGGCRRSVASSRFSGMAMSRGWGRLQAAGKRLPTFRAHNEQAMAHAAIAYAKTHARRRMMACTSSVGPGATNMVTAAAVAHVNRLPVQLSSHFIDVPMLSGLHFLSVRQM